MNIFAYKLLVYLFVYHPIKKFLSKTANEENKIRIIKCKIYVIVYTMLHNEELN